MISIQHTISELERADHKRAMILDCYVSAIRSLARYAVNLDETITRPHRESLSALAVDVEAGDLQTVAASNATFSTLVRDYRDQAAGYLGGLREELASTARAFQEILTSLCDSDGDHEKSLRGILGRLRTVSKATDAAVIRAVLVPATESIERSLEEIRRQHQLTVVQFQQEIRVLHKRIDELETSASIDNLTKLFTRRETEQRIAAAPAGGYRLLLVRVAGFRVPAVAQLAATFAKRLRNSLPEGTAIGRWTAEGFVALLELTMPEAVTRKQWVVEQLSGAYSCIEDGKMARPTLDIKAIVVDTTATRPERLLEQAAEFFGSA
jgi:GGDEF domain-containing protein